MDVNIEFEGSITDEISYELNQLGDLIQQECDTNVEFNKQELKPGVKDSGLVIGLTIAGLALSGVQTLISALQYWESKQQKYSISISLGNKKYYYSNIEKEKADELLAKIRQLPENVLEKAEIKIVKK